MGKSSLFLCDRVTGHRRPSNRQQHGFLFREPRVVDSVPPDNIITLLFQNDTASCEIHAKPAADEHQESGALFTPHPLQTLVATRVDAPFDLHRLGVTGIVDILEVSENPPTIQWGIRACISCIYTAFHKVEPYQAQTGTKVRNSWVDGGQGMEKAELVPEKVAWVLVREGRVLVTRNRGVEVFYFPGGKREPGESDAQTLAREIDEELQSRIDTATMVHVGTFETRSATGGRVEFRMICYTAEHTGPLLAAREIAESDWFGYGDRARVSAVDQMVFDALHATGQLP